MKESDVINTVMSFFPKNIKNTLFAAAMGERGSIKEIRLYKNMPIIFLTDRGTRFPDANGGTASFPNSMSIAASGELLSDVVVNSTGASVFSMEKELMEGYVSAPSGIRIGVCLQWADKCFSVDRITSVCIRLPYADCFETDREIRELTRKGGLLIAGPPCSGKTTLLKACCRELSDIRSADFKKICIIDTRGELACFSDVHKGRYAADVITCKNPGEGILRGVRLMSPEYIVCDEICSDYEAQSILEGLNTGVKFISAMHSGNISQLVKRSQFIKLFYGNVFNNIAMLSDVQVGSITKIYGREEIYGEIVRSDFYLHRNGSDGHELNGINTEKSKNI